MISVVVPLYDGALHLRGLLEALASSELVATRVDLATLNPGWRRSIHTLAQESELCDGRVETLWGLADRRAAPR